MTRTLCLTLLVLTVLPVYAQNTSFPRTCRMASRYDRAADATTVQCDDLVPRGEAPAGLSVGINQFFRGKSPNETARFRFHLASNRGGGTRRSPLLFQGAETFYLQCDSSVLQLSIREYNNTFFELIRYTSETAQAEIRAEDLPLVLAAHSLEGRWGTTSFKFSDKALAAIKEFISNRISSEDGR